jgi:hypothetical protein
MERRQGFDAFGLPRKTIEWAGKILPRRRPSDMEGRGFDLSHPFEPYFPILSPGETRAIGARGYVVIPIFDPKGRVPDLRGRHIGLRLVLDHTLYPGLAEKLRSWWQPAGQLWDGVGSTESMNLDVARKPEISACNAEYRLD